MSSFEDNTPALLPSSAQIALSLIVLKSKPADVSVPNYLSSLREHITSSTGRNPAHVQRHIDSSTYWKQAYEKSEAAQTELLDRVYALEQELRSASFGTLRSPPHQELNKAKRKRDEQPVTKANSRSKRRAVSTRPPVVSAVHLADQSEQDLVVETDQNKTLTTFLRALFELRQALSPRQFEAFDLCVTIRTLCRAAIKAVKDATAIKDKNVLFSEGWTMNVRDTCAAITSSYSSIIQGLDMLHKSNDPNRGPKVAAAVVVHLFQSVLGQMHAVILLDATKKYAASALKAKNKKRRLRDASPETHTSRSLRSGLKELVRLLANMITLLDPSKTGQCNLLEGLICAFIDHLGSALSFVVFTEPDSNSADHAPLGILPPEGLQDTAGMDSAVALRAVETEAPYLVFLLKSAMVCLSAHHAKLSLFSLPGSNNPGQGALLRNAKEKLQNTLLRGVFGDDDETFADALHRADNVAVVELEEDSDANKRQDGISGWFVGEVWQHLGWEILSDRGGMTEEHFPYSHAGSNFIHCQHQKDDLEISV